MNKRQKKKLFRKTIGSNPPEELIYTSLDYHILVNKPWGGLAALKKQETTRAVECFNHNIRNRNTQIRTLRRYIR